MEEYVKSGSIQSTDGTRNLDNPRMISEKITASRPVQVSHSFSSNTRAHELRTLLTGCGNLPNPPRGWRRTQSSLSRATSHTLRERSMADSRVYHGAPLDYYKANSLYWSKETSPLCNRDLRDVRSLWTVSRVSELVWQVMIVQVLGNALSGSCLILMCFLHCE